MGGRAVGGIEAPEQGEFYSQTFTLDGDQIEINARATTNTGYLTVEILQGGKLVEQYSRAACIPVRADALWEQLRWSGKADLSDLRGKKLQRRVLLDHAKIFGYRVISATSN